MKDRSTAMEYIRHRQLIENLALAGRAITRTDMLYSIRLERGLERETERKERAQVPSTILYDVPIVRPVPHSREAALSESVSQSVAIAWRDAPSYVRASGVP